MTERGKRLQPTKAELAILATLWEHGRSTVPEIWERLSGKRQTGYTTILKQLQVMEKKGLVGVEKKRRPHLYWAAVSKDRTERKLLDDLAGIAFSGSLLKLAIKALSHRPPSAAELQEIRELLDRLEEQKE